MAVLLAPCRSQECCFTKTAANAEHAVNVTKKSVLFVLVSTHTTPLLSMNAHQCVNIHEMSDSANLPHCFVLFRYWFQKDLDKEWLPVGNVFRRFVSDMKRVWPGPGRQGLELLQVGVSTPIDDIDVPHIAMPLPAQQQPQQQPQQQTQQQTAAHHTTSTSNTESRFFSP